MTHNPLDDMPTADGPRHTVSIDATLTLAALQDLWIERALVRNASPTKAAKALGIGRATIYRWIQKRAICACGTRTTEKESCGGCDRPLCSACHAAGEHECP